MTIAWRPRFVFFCFSAAVVVEGIGGKKTLEIHGEKPKLRYLVFFLVYMFWGVGP